jgi:hypothetical protein
MASSVTSPRSGRHVPPNSDRHSVRCSGTFSNDGWKKGEWSVDPDPRIPAELDALREALIAELQDGEQRQQYVRSPSPHPPAPRYLARASGETKHGHASAMAPPQVRRARRALLTRVPS